MRDSESGELWPPRRWDLERSSREKSDDSRDSATRERDRKYAQERLRDRERGRREEVILYRHQTRDSESSEEDESIQDATRPRVHVTQREVAGEPKKPCSLKRQLSGGERNPARPGGDKADSEAVGTKAKTHETGAKRRSDKHDDTGHRRSSDRHKDMEDSRRYRDSDRRRDSHQRRENNRHGGGTRRRSSNRHDSTDGTRGEDRGKDTENHGKAAEVRTGGKGTGVITSRTGGAYIPPARLRLMQEKITDKSSTEYQRIAWEALKKSINGLVNKANISNMEVIIRELVHENLVRGRGILCRTIMQAQAASPTFTHVYGAMVAVINSKFPQTGELLLKRLVIQFRRGFKRNDKIACMASVRFIAHLVNQQVAHEVLALEILTLLLSNPTDDSVEVAIAFLKECGMKLTEVSPKGVHAIFERLRSILHEAQLDKRVQYMIEVMFAIRKDGFSAHPSIIEELNLVSEEDQYTHLLTLDDPTDGEDILNVFKYDPDYLDNEEKYAGIAKDLLGSDSEGGESGSESDDEEEEEEENEGENQEIIDSTETNLIALRRTIYLTIQSSVNFEECAHKLLKLEIKPGQVEELCHMILDCCAQQRTYEKFYGLLAQRFCQLKKEYAEPFEHIFLTSYDTIHRFETNKLRNVAKFFAHLLFTDAIPWTVLRHIKLTEEDTTSSSRIFIKILFQELCEFMGLSSLNERIKDPTLQEAFDGLFPRDLPRNTRFAINFFTSIGLGGLTDDLREHLKSAPKLPPPEVVMKEQLPASSSSSSSSSSGSSSSSDSSSSDSDSSSGSSSSMEKVRAERRRKSDSNVHRAPKRQRYSHSREAKRRA